MFLAPWREQWGWLDDLLVYAYQRFVDTTCAECGGFVVECRSPENRNAYVVSSDQYCYRKEALDRVTGAKDYKADPGQLLSVSPIDEGLISWPGFAAKHH